MKDQDLVQQLNKFRDIKLDSTWLASNREILATQIYSGAPEAPAMSWAVKFSLVSSRLLQPQYIAIMIVAFFFGSGVFGWQASQDTKPGDTMYMAKRLGERAQGMVTFGDTSIAKLNLELASKRVAELKQVTADNAMSQSPDNDKVATAKATAKQQIAKARQQVSRLKVTVPVVETPAVTTVPETKSSDVTAAETPLEVYETAGSSKSDERIDISIPDGPDLIISSTTVATPDSIIDEAEKLLEGNDLDGAVKKLKEINEMIK